MKRWLLIPMLLWLAACQPGADDSATSAERPAEERRLRVYTVNYPLAWLAEQIGGDLVEVVFPVPGGVDPAHWQPSAELVLEYQAADLVLANGAGYAPWLRFASLSPARLVDTTRGLEGRLLPAQSGSHSHGPGGEHEHGGTASHTWLDSTLASEQARVVAEALERIAPDAAQEIAGRLDETLAVLDRSDRALSRIFSSSPGRQIFYSHPVYQYVDARFQLDGLAFAWEPDLEPGEAEWRKLEAAVDRSRATWMLWEAPPLDSVADRLNALGIAPIVYETGANPQPRDGYDSVLQRNQRELQGSRSAASLGGSAEQRTTRGN